MKKYIFSFICLFIFLLFPSLNINAVSSNRVDYTIKDYFVQSDIDIAGSLNVKELIICQVKKFSRKKSSMLQS